MKWIQIIFSCLIVCSCNTISKVSETQKTNPIVSPEGTYAITTLNGKNTASYGLTLQFKDSTQQISGYSGCNRFFGKYTFKHKTLTIDALNRTKKSCNDDISHIESHFISALKKSNTVEITNTNIVLSHDLQPLLSGTLRKKDRVLSLNYTATSRGYYQKITITPNSISKGLKHDGKVFKKEIESAQWQTIVQYANAINLKHLPHIIAPSKDFLFDGAPIARLSITTPEKTYQSATFDHGNPPKEITALMKALLSLAQNVE